MIKVCSRVNKWDRFISGIIMAGAIIVCDILLLSRGCAIGPGKLIAVNVIFIPIPVILFKKYIWAARSFCIEESGIIIYSVLHREIKRYAWEDFKHIGVVRYFETSREASISIICSPYEDLERILDQDMDVVDINIRWIDEYNEFVKYVPEGMITDFPSDEIIFLLSPVKTDWLMTEEEKAEAHDRQAREKEEKEEKR